MKDSDNISQAALKDLETFMAYVFLAIADASVIINLYDISSGPFGTSIKLSVSYPVLFSVVILNSFLMLFLAMTLGAWAQRRRHSGQPGGSDGPLSGAASPPEES